MAFFRTGGGGGIPAALKSGMNNVLNKKFGTTGQDYDPNGWPDDVNLMGALEIKTATGTIATFSDGADDVPIADGVFDVDFTGTAVSEMTISQIGKNLLNEANKCTNLSYFYFSQTPAAVVFPYLPAGTYTFSTKIDVGVGLVVFDVFSDGTVIFDDSGYWLDEYTVTFTLSTGKKNVYFELILTSDPVLTTDLFDFQLEKGSTATTHENYISVADKSVDFNGSIYGGFYNSKMGVLTSTKASDGSDLAEPVETNIGPTEIASLLGHNNLFCDTGNTSVDYRSSGTETIVTPTLITKQITQNGTYNAAADNADGYSSVVVNTPAGQTGLVVMDFSNISTPFTINGVSYGATGAVFDNAGDYISLPFFHNGMELEIDVSSMNLTADNHRRFVSSNTNMGFMFRRDNGGSWSFYNGSWFDSTITDGSFFADSTVRIIVDNSNYWHIYKNDVLIFEPAGALALSNVCIGSSGGTGINNVTITGIRIKEST